MDWYKRNYFLNLKKFFKSLINYIYFDLKSVFYNFKKIFKNPFFLIFFLFALFSVQIWFFFFFIVFFFLYIYYFLIFVYYFIFFKKIEFNENNPYIFTYIKINDTNKNLFHFYYFFFKLPQLWAYKSFYLFFKVLYSDWSFLSIFFLFFLFILILPLRFLIKFLTGFNYICIKLASKLTVDAINLSLIDCDNINNFYDNFMCDLYLTYYNPILSEVLKYKIYLKSNLIIFNPLNNKFLNLFSNSKEIKKALFFANKLFSLRFIETSKISNHPCFTSLLNDYNLKELTVLIQSSAVYRPIKSVENDFIKDKADVSLSYGVVGKPNVFDHRPVTINLLKNKLKLSSIKNWNNVIDPDLQKKIALKALFLNFYKKDLIMGDGQIKESLDFNLYIERIFELYKNNQLSDDAYNALSYLIEFSQNNDIFNNQSKQEIWNYVFEKSIITKEGIIIPDFEENGLPLRLKNMLTLVE